MTFVGTERFIPEILEEHFETLQFLWARRAACLHSPTWTMRDLTDHDERIAAHTDGLVLAGEDGEAIVRPGLAAEDVFVSLTAAYVLLAREEEPLARGVLDVFREAQGATLDGLRLALCYAPIPSLLSPLRELVSAAEPPVAAAAAEILAFRGQPLSPSKTTLALVSSPTAAVRQSAWRAARYAAGPMGDLPVGFDWSALLQAGLADADAEVRAQCVETAAWTRHARLLEHCRRCAQTPGTPEPAALLMLGALGEPLDLDLILHVGGDARLGRSRFEVLSIYGHPQTVNLLLQEMDNQDPAVAAAAGTAFRQITGIDVGSGVRVPLPGPKPHDEFEKEFAEEVELPDLPAAQAHWSKLAEPFSKGMRWSRGIDVSKAVSPAVLSLLDLRSRRESILRARAAGTASETCADLERLTRFPGSAPPPQ